MAINKNYTFPIKSNGPGHLIHDNQWFGTDEFTWNFKTHWPELTLDYVEDNLGVNLVVPAGSLEQAEQNLAKVSRVSRLWAMGHIPTVSTTHLEYRVAKDPDVLQEVLQFQLEILQSWGGYNSLYRVIDGEASGSVGKAAELFYKMSSLGRALYSFRIDPDDVRRDY